MPLIAFTGAQAVQLSDSWIGALSVRDCREFVLPYSKKDVRGIIVGGVPTIHFGTGTAMLFESMWEAGGA